jgi:hypothetical protein
VAHPAKEDQDSLIGVATNETAGVLLVEHTVAVGVVRRALLTADVQLTGISLVLDRRTNSPMRATSKSDLGNSPTTITSPSIAARLDTRIGDSSPSTNAARKS